MEALPRSGISRRVFHWRRDPILIVTPPQSLQHTRASSRIHDVSSRESNSPPPPASPTELLDRAVHGDSAAAAQLFPLVYETLRGLASRFLGDQRSRHTLQPTALVHEAFVRLVDREHTAVFENRLHFYRVAARAMRGVLVHHAEAREAVKRGGGRAREPLADPMAPPPSDPTDLLALDEALTELTAHDEQLARLVELRFFAGLTIAETADLLGVSTPTVERGWRVARSFLRRAMRGESS